MKRLRRVPGSGNRRFWDFPAAEKKRQWTDRFEFLAFLAGVIEQLDECTQQKEKVNNVVICAEYISSVRFGEVCPS